MSDSYNHETTSIPAIVPDLHPALFDPDRKAVDIFISGRGFYCTGFYAKTRAVAGADNLVAFQSAAGDFRAIVGTDIFKRIKLAVNFKDGDIRTIDIDDDILAIRQGIFIYYINPV
jgi:hypothetical protein